MNKIVAPIREIIAYPLEWNREESMTADIICGYCGEKIDKYTAPPNCYIRLFRQPKVCQKCGAINDYDRMI